MTDESEAILAQTAELLALSDDELAERLLADPGLFGRMQALAACDWGRGFSFQEGYGVDNSPCNRMAKQRVVLHDGERERTLQLCDIHLAVINNQSTPRTESAQ